VSNGITRRAMLAGLPGCALASIPSAKKAKPLPRSGEFFRFLDPLTETPVVRLTSIGSNSFLPAPANRFVSVKDRFLVFSSDRAGALAPFQVDLHNGILTQLARCRRLAPDSLCLNRRQNALYFLDEDSLQEVTLANRKSRTLAQGVSSFCEFGHGSGTDAAFAVVRQRRLEMLSGDEDRAPLAEDVENFCLARPGGQGCLFTRAANTDEREFWYVPFPARAAKAILLVKGKVTNPLWTPDGQALLFLREVPRSNFAASEIHAVIPEAPVERCLARTSQFAAFSPNADGSVFVGASRSKAQPTVLLLLAAVQRELTLCEHRASRAAAVSPVFSPDSKRVYFQSDHEGKSALYSVNVEKLVESTPGGDL
jgi:oligogalacturonide lyase